MPVLRFIYPDMTTSPLDLAILVHDLSASGVVRNAVRIAAGMAERGLTTEIWVVRRDGKFLALVPENVMIRVIGSRLRLPVRRLETLLSIPAIAASIRKHRPRVLLSAGNHFHWAAGPAYAWAGRPRDTALIARASNAPPDSSIPVVNTVLHFLDALKYRGMHRIVAVSSELATLLEVDLRIPANKIRTIRNGVNVQDIQSRAKAPLQDPWFTTGSPPVIVAAGRLSRQKNFPLLLKAFALLRRERVVRLIILGDGPGREAANLRALAVRLGVSDDFRLAGHEANPMRFFSRAAVFGMSSLWEGASNVILEALACGCPVVAVNCPTGIKEQLAGGEAGRIVAMNDPEALAMAMKDQLDAPLERDRIIAQAQVFKQDEMLDRYHALFTGREPA